MQLMDVKKQLETQTSQYHRTREQLSAAQLELNNLKLQMSSRESRLVSPTALTGEKFLSNLFKFGSSTSLTAKTRALLIEKTLCEVVVFPLQACRAVKVIRRLCVPS